MWLARAAITRPMMITMLFAAIVVLGLISRSRMPQELRPDVEFPFVTVVTVYPGAGPEEIETLVTKPIEDAVGSIANLKEITSTSQEGLSVVGLEFELGTDVADATADVREKVDSTRSTLPEDAEPPSITKADISSMPVITLGMRGPQTPRELRHLADDIVKDQLGRVKGAASVAISGGDVREIQVLVNKARLNAYGLSISEVVAAISAENLNLPAGDIKQGDQNFAVRVLGEFKTAEQLRAMRLRIPDRTGVGPGWNIPLTDIAEVQDTIEDADIISRLNGEPAVVIAIQKQTDANTLDVSEGVKEELEQLKKVLPPGITFELATDEGQNVHEQMQDTNRELMLSIILVVLVVFLFLHSARATFIVSVAIPTSLIATFIPMTAFGFSLNFMTMLAFTLAVGILVDDAIVVLENIDRHLEDGEPPREAALNGRTEIGLAAVTITLVDVVVFVPVAFMGGIVGQFFRDFGLTVASATLFSLFVSFTLTPMLASRLYKRETRQAREAHHVSAWTAFWERRFAALERMFDRIDTRYRSTLQWSLDNRWLTVVIGVVALTTIIIMLMPPINTPFGAKARMFNLIVLVGLLGGSAFWTARDKKAALLFIAAAAAATLLLHLRVKGEFIPEVDRGQIGITIEAPAGSSLKYTSHAAEHVEEIVAGLPETEYYVTTLGTKSAGGFSGGGDSGAQYARVSLELVDRGRRATYEEVEEAGTRQRKMTHRTRGIQEVMAEIRSKAARNVPGVKITVFSAESTGMGGAPIQMEIQGSNTAELTTVADKLAAAMTRVEGTRDVETSWRIGRPELQVTVDRERAADYGVSTGQIAMALRTAIEGDTTSKFRVEGTEYNIRVQVRPEDRGTVESLESIIVSNKEGAPVYLSDVADIRMSGAPTKIDRKNRQRQVSVSAFLREGFDLSSVQAGVNQAAASVPKGNTQVRVGGTSEVQQESFGYMLSALMLAVVLVYMLMAGLFESLFNPLIIMLSLPQALVGALLLLVLTGRSMSIISMIGIILLMGIVTKNAILLIDFTATLRKRGMSRTEAILTAGPTRLRPILMTTISLISAMIPTMFAASSGSEQRAPLATAVVGGLLVSTLLTLLVIPASYTLVEDFVHGLGRLMHSRRGGNTR